MRKTKTIRSLVSVVAFAAAVGFAHAGAEEGDGALWSLQAVAKPEAPEVADKDWPRTAVDRFILARIEQAGLTPVGDANPNELIRRLYFDLHGLPPNFEQVGAFVSDFNQRGQFAVEELVDALLASPHFGERWGRHWLDIARYGESNGNDGLGRNPTFPHAWRYRDYVIDAFNRDVPYDRFITEQIAGDLLEADSVEERNRQLVATGFLALGSKPAKAMNNNFDMDVVDNQIDVVSTGIMGLSVACARCHDHKHDPIPTSDYYALAGIFKSSETMWGKAANEKLTAPATPLHQLKAPGDQSRETADGTPDIADGYHTAVGKLNPALHHKLDASPEWADKVESGISFSPKTLGEFKSGRIHFKTAVIAEGRTEPVYSVSFWFRNDTPNSARPVTAYLFSRGPVNGNGAPGGHVGIGGAHNQAHTGKLIFFNGNDGGECVSGPTVIPPGTWNHVVLIRDGKRVKLFLNGETKPEIEAEVGVTAGESDTFFIGSRNDNMFPLVGRLGEFAFFSRALSDKEAKGLHEASGMPVGTKRAEAAMLAMGVRDRAKVEDCKINLNGDSKKLGKSVPRGFLTAYEGPDGLKVNAKQSGRLQLARWLVSESHPLTARVMANRIWLHLFGRGIVTTPDDFGVYGARPSHPLLLDHLATRLVEHEWSLKLMIRELVLSRTYQLSCGTTPTLLEKDPDNVLQGRHNRRRLDAESLRDTILAASGQLNRKPGEGSTVQDTDILINKGEFEHKPSNHRSIYLCMLRSAPPPELAAFDLPDGISAAGNRDETTLPAHALFLLNSPFVLEQAEHFARSVIEAVPMEEPEKRIAEVFRRGLNREPGQSEVSGALNLLKAVDADLRLKEADETEREVKVWASLCQTVLASSEFRYVD